jgi:RNA recognition motif-containing protein
MSQLLNGSICLSDIPKEKITTSEKNGKKYLNISVWINDEPDQYNNNGSIQVSQTKEEREAQSKKLYIGNLKFPVKQSSTAPTAAPHTASATVPELDNSLPF